MLWPHASNLASHPRRTGCRSRPGALASARPHLRRQPLPHLPAVGRSHRRWLLPLGSHLHQFFFADGHRVGIPDLDDEDPAPLHDYSRVRLSRLDLREQFAYVFDFGDDWQHLCTVGPRRIDPIEVLGIVPDRPLPFWAWGDIPDQYRRRWDGDDGESAPPLNPRGRDLPDLRPWARHRVAS